MLNAEKYKDEILNRVEWNKTVREACFYRFSYAVEHVSGIGSNDLEKVLKWLFSEYEPPSLHNGDDLKVGDWIMVSDDGKDWKKRQFLYFWKGYFFAANLLTTPEQAQAVKWNYARLPEEGE